MQRVTLTNDWVKVADTSATSVLIQALQLTGMVGPVEVVAAGSLPLASVYGLVLEPTQWATRTELGTGHVYARAADRPGAVVVVGP